jgi:ribonuclease D
VKIFHGADFDVMSLRRDFAFEFRGIFDTMLAGQLLGDEKLSLRDYVIRFFGVTLEKAYTRCDWARRPLDDKQLEYCFHDVAFLVRLMDIQRARLAEADLVEEAEIEFERLARREPSKKEFDPHAWSKLPGARELGPVQQAALANIFTLRDRHARQLDRPPFKVLGPDTMVRIARTMPESGEGLRGVKGVSSYVAGRMGREVMDALRDAERDGSPPPRPRGPGGDPMRRLDMTAQKRLGRIKDWRAAASARTHITTMAILPNYAMYEIARIRPETAEALAVVPGVGTKRAARWGSEILAAMQ